jgi:hypothetical protein
MPLLVPCLRRNAPRGTRTRLPQPPAKIYTPGNFYCPLDHTSPHEEPPASICTAAAAAIDKDNSTAAVHKEDIWCAAAAATVAKEHSREDFPGEDSSDEGVENLVKAFQDLVGLKTSGLDDLDYSSDDNDNDYFQEIEDKAHFIVNSDAKKVNHS